MMRRKELILTLLVLACNRSQKAKLDEDANTARVAVPPEPPQREMIRIGGGHIRMYDRRCYPGSYREKHPGKDQRQLVDVEVQPFAIDRETAICHDLEKCVEAGRCKDLGIQPCVAGVANVPFATGEAFCAWRGMKLPTYPQWQRAMRGPEGFKYPRGNEWSEEYLSDQVTIDRGRRYVSPEGVVYFIAEFGWWLDKEFTRDTDCLTEPPRTFRLAAGLWLFELDNPTPVWESSAYPIRCVSE
jgi:formylglycine-generating enzyme required for sulfatase activity